MGLVCYWFSSKLRRKTKLLYDWIHNCCQSVDRHISISRSAPTSIGRGRTHSFTRTFVCPYAFILCCMITIAMERERNNIEMCNEYVAATTHYSYGNFNILCSVLFSVDIWMFSTILIM